MNKSNKLIAWFMAGAAAIGAAVGGGYYASRTGEPPAETAAAPAAPATQPAAEPAKPAETATNATPEPQAEGVPTFSVLRVEKDGSAVVAGTAKPDTKIDLMAGSEVLASAQAGPTGDFAIVLDTPLAPGAHELVLRAIDPSGATVTSAETGIVNVPAGEGGELVAMVSKAGEASRLMQAGDKEAEAAIAAVEAEVKAEQQAAAAPAADAAAPAAAETPAAPAEAAAPAAETVKPVLVSAVDFEDGRIYVAGTGEPGRTVNIYIDGAMTGSTVVGPDGAFLLEAPSQLTPGEHTIRADLLSADGTQVAARAEVPLVHEAPAEVAAAETKPAEAAPAADTGSGAAATETAGQTAVAAAGEAAPETAPAQQTQTQAGTAAATAEVPVTAEVPAAAPAQENAPQAESGSQTTAAGTAEAPAVEATQPAAGTTAEAPAAEQPASAEATVPPAATAEAAAPAASEQAEPIKTGASVIIRRGDNLWRISRRMLGKGVRYTTIYEANRDQIKNPALIYPGQVFDVPGATSVN
jgi:nucleoid-associated protein YgaU